MVTLQPGTGAAPPVEARKGTRHKVYYAFLLLPTCHERLWLLDQQKQINTSCCLHLARSATHDAGGVDDMQFESKRLLEYGSHANQHRPTAIMESLREALGASGVLMLW